MVVEEKDEEGGEDTDEDDDEDEPKEACISLKRLIQTNLFGVGSTRSLLSLQSI